MRLSLICWGLVILALLAVPTPAFANAALPMMALVWAPFWILIVPLVLVEAAIARKLLHLSYGRSVALTCTANLFSTGVAVPLAWAILWGNEVFLGFVVGGVFACYPPTSEVFPFIQVNPWLPPYENAYWQVPSAGILLCGGFLFVSVFVDYLVAWLWLPTQEGRVKTWSWLANGLSHSVVAAILLGILVYAAIIHCRK